MFNDIYSSRNIQVLLIIFFFLTIYSISAQNHVSVPLDNRVYYLIEMAETRGLCSPLPAVKPYTRAKIIEIISEILGSRGLNASEKRILEDLREEFVKGEAGLDLQNGMYRFDIKRKDESFFSGEMGLGLESINSIAFYTGERERFFGTGTWGTGYVNADIGRNFSFNIEISAGLLRAQRKSLGGYYLYASQAGRNDPEKDVIKTYSQPLAFFPFTYQKGWDGYMFNIKEDMTSGNMQKWPDELSIAPRMLAEMTGTVLNGMLLLRAGRMQREWGGMTQGSSLSFNASARPFVGFEFNFYPVSWLSFSSITGILEFDNSGGISEPALSFQNAFSLSQFELNYKNYFHISMGSAAIWAKRFEFGYIFPLIDNFFYQNFIGDFDNVSIFMNFKGQYPGIGKLWFSFFMDEVEISSMSKMFELDRHMFAWQAGMQYIIPSLPFASVTASYTKIEPYNYTHQKVKTPWYEVPMEQAYVNNGVSLGHYLPPNSDEIKLRFEIHPVTSTSGFLQYQLIRHGADFGRQQVDGSSLLSELDTIGRSDKISLRKDFLKDGAYQWTHVIKAGAQYKFNSLPLTIFGEVGGVHTYFKEIEQNIYDSLNPGRNPQGEYFKYTSFIFTLGFRIFN